MTAQTVLITGCNRGLGLEMARQYAEQGWTVHACARKPDKAEALKALATLHTNLTLHRLDVSRDRDIKALAETLKDEPLDLLINNAGVYGPKGISLSEIDRETWLDVLNINTISPLLVTRALLPNLRLGEGAKVAILSSKMGSQTDNSSGGSYIYRTGKSAVNAVGKSLAVDLQIDGISVVILHPGWAQTEMGGPAALISTEVSVKGMRQVIDQLDLASSGRFMAYDGKAIGW